MAEQNNSSTATEAIPEPQSEIARKMHEDKESRINAIVNILENLPVEKIYEVRKFVDEVAGSVTATER